MIQDIIYLEIALLVTNVLWLILCIIAWCRNVRLERKNRPIIDYHQDYFDL